MLGQLDASACSGARPNEEGVSNAGKARLFERIFGPVSKRLRGRSHFSVAGNCYDVTYLVAQEGVRAKG